MVWLRVICCTLSVAVKHHCSGSSRTWNDHITKIDEWFNQELARLLQDGDVVAFKTALKERMIDAYMDGKEAGRAEISELFEKET